MFIEQKDQLVYESVVLEEKKRKMPVHTESWKSQ